MEIIQKKNPMLRLTESAIMIAFSVVLSEIKIINMPFGGSITAFSMLPLIIIAYRYGPKWGLFTGMVAGLFQMLLGMQNLKYGATFIAVVAIILFDYLLAFGVTGFGGIFRGKMKNQAAELGAGALVACFFRYVCHFISGWTIWGIWAPKGTPAWVYSLEYNATYMVPETIITVAGAVLISAILDFSSVNITRSKPKEPEFPRSNTALAAKLCGTFIIIGGILQSIFTVINIFISSSKPKIPKTQILSVIAVCVAVGIVLYSLGEIVQLLHDLRYQNSFSDKCSKNKQFDKNQ